MTVQQAMIDWFKKRGTEPSRTKEDFERDAQELLDALNAAGFKVVPLRG
jgi:hypothetical protein